MNSKDSQLRSALSILLQAASQYKASPDEFVSELASELETLKPLPRDLEAMVAGLRSAVKVHMSPESAAEEEPRCAFCGKPYAKVRTMIVSANSCICDECSISTLRTLSLRSGFRFIRLGYKLFELVAKTGYFMTRHHNDMAASR